MRETHQAIPAPTYIGFTPRLLASLVDTIVVLPLLIAFIFALYRHAGHWWQIIILGSANNWINWGIPAAFTLVFWLIKAATPGKMAVQAVIVDAKTLQKPSSWQLGVRYLGYYVCLFSLGLGFLWIIWDARKQGWHDKMAGTVVIASKPASR